MTPVYLVDWYFRTILYTYIGPRLLLCPSELSQILLITETLESVRIESFSIPRPNFLKLGSVIYLSTLHHL